MRFAAVTVIAATLLATTPLLAAPASGGDVALAPHRAAYDILDEDGKRVGAMSYSLLGNACSGYATETVMDLPGDKGHARMSFEKPGGTDFEYGDERDSEGRQEVDVHGTAHKVEGGVDVTLVDTGKAAVMSHYEGEVDFPVDYDRRVLAAALGGTSRFVTGRILDDTAEGGARPRSVSTTIEAAEPGEGLPRELADLKVFKVTTRFFPETTGGDAEAEHVIVSDEFENGITSVATETSDGHAITMQLSALEMTPQAACKAVR